MLIPGYGGPAGDNVNVDFACVFAKTSDDEMGGISTFIVPRDTKGFRVVETPTDEFIKAGGSVKCLVLMLDAFERWPGAE